MDNTKKQSEEYFEEEPAGEEYVSDSTIDNPPKEPKQGELIELKKPEKPRPAEQKFQLSLKVGPDKEPLFMLPVASGVARADMVEECMSKGFNSERFRAVLRSIIGEPYNAEYCNEQIATEREAKLEEGARILRAAMKNIQVCDLPEYPEKQNIDRLVINLNAVREKIGKALERYDELLAEGSEVDSE